MKKAEKPERQPGDLILDRYMPDATPEQREEARENLRAYLRVALRIATRLENEARERESKTPLSEAQRAGFEQH